ncbi:MAG TPA: hypothetical protein V6C81_28310 [Planktothrix sp.]
MRFTPEQLHTIECALELALEMRLEDFDCAKDKCDRGAMQQAIRAARDIKKFNQLLACIEREHGVAG